MDVSGWVIWRRSLQAVALPLMAWHLALTALLLIRERRALIAPFIRLERKRGLLWALCGVAFLVRAVWIPALTRHVYDGHEADYFDVWRGIRVGPEVGYRASDFLRSLYQVLGPVLGGSGDSLLYLSLFASLMAIPLVFLWGRDLTGREGVGLWAALLLALDPQVSFWASSAYNVQLPFLAGLSALVSLERGMRRGAPALIALSGVWLAMAVALRPEAVLLTFPLVLRVLLARPTAFSDRRVLVWCPFLVALVLVYLVMGQRPSVGGESFATLLTYFSSQVFLPDFLRPYTTPWLAPVLLASLWVVFRSSELRPAGVVLLVLALSQHFAYVAFDDYGGRHTLFVRLSLAILFAIFLEHLGRARAGRIGVAGLVTAVVLLFSLEIQDVSGRYYATAREFYEAEPLFRLAPNVSLDELGGCVFVAEGDAVPTITRASHFELFDPERRRSLLGKYQGCVIFVMDVENYQASSRAVDGRALRVKRFFDLTLLGKVVDEASERYALLYRVNEK